MTAEELQRRKEVLDRRHNLARARRVAELELKQGQSVLYGKTKLRTGLMTASAMIFSS